jgi:heptosyltransferase I
VSAAGERIVVLRLSALGDVIHTIPAVAALRQARPDARIGWLVEAAYADLVRIVAPVDEVFPFRTKAWRRSWWKRETAGEAARALGALRRFARGGVAIDFQGLAKSALAGRLSGARSRIGFDRAAVREKTTLFLNNRRVAVDTSRHVIEWNLELARSAGARAAAPPWVDFTPFVFDEGGRLAPYAATHPLILIPGAGHPSKRWSPGRFAELADRAAEELGLRSLVVWGPGEERLAEAVTGRSSAADPAPPTDLRGLAWLLRSARGVVAGDTGPLHLAAALRTPVVALFGPTDPLRNGPWGQGRNVVSSATREIDSIGVEEVAAKVREVLR